MRTIYLFLSLIVATNIFAGGLNSGNFSSRDIYTFEVYCREFPTREECDRPIKTKIDRFNETAKYCNVTADECEDTSKYYENLGCITLQERAELMVKKLMPICTYVNDQLIFKQVCKCPGILIEDDDEIIDNDEDMFE